MSDQPVSTPAPSAPSAAPTSAEEIAALVDAIEPTAASSDSADQPASDRASEQDDGGEQADAAKDDKPEAKSDEDKPAEEKPDEKPAVDEEALKKAALKYANSTMAAARRAQAKADVVRADNERLTGELKTTKARLDEVLADPRAIVSHFGGVKEFLRRFADAGEPAKEPTAEDRITKLEREIKERDEKIAKAEAERQIEAAKTRTFDALAKDDRYDLVVNTRRGRDDLWDAVEAYAKLHGQVPDEAVYALADEIEKLHAADLAKSKKFSAQQQSAKTAAPPPAKAAPAGRTSGTKTITHTPAAPAQKRRPVDDDEERLETLRQLGLVQ